MISATDWVEDDTIDTAIQVFDNCQWTRLYRLACATAPQQVNLPVSAIVANL